MLKASVIVCFVLLITACNPFSQADVKNQFKQKNKQLIFMGHKLGHWLESEPPQCKHCSFNLYTKKMPTGSMLFKEINNERGDLVFLSATNIRHHFALQAGGHSYSLGVKIDKQSVLLSNDLFGDITLPMRQKKLLALEGQNYFVLLQKIDVGKASVDLIFWRIKPL